MTDHTDEPTDWEPTDEGERSSPDDRPSDGDSTANGRANDPGNDRPNDRAGDAAYRGETAPGNPRSGDRSLREYVQWSLLAILLLLTLIATIRLYFSASAAVDRFVTRQYRPLFQAAFNLVVLLAAGVGLSVLVRRLS